MGRHDGQNEQRKNQPLTRRLERHVRRKADEQAAAEAEQSRHYRVNLASWNSRGRTSGSGYPAWLDERDAPRLPPTRADRHSTYDKEAERTVSAGGGIQALLATTELPTLEAAADSIDPEILIKAFDNDALERGQPQPLAATLRPRLRKLVPDTHLLRRRAAGEPLRMLASDYAVAHTTLARFFARPEIKQQLRQTVQELRVERRARTARSSSIRQPEPTWFLRQPPQRRRARSGSRRRN